MTGEGWGLLGLRCGFFNAISFPAAAPGALTPLSKPMKYVLVVADASRLCNQQPHWMA